MPLFRARLALLLSLAAPACGARHKEEEALALGLNASDVDAATASCDLSRYTELQQRYKNLVLAGTGANGCVYLAEDSQNGGAKVAIKVSKRTGTLKSWKKECTRSRDIQVRACTKGGEALKLVERYLPVCTDVGGTNDAPYMIMPAAASKGIDSTRQKLPEDARKSVFSQMVGALAAMHGIGLSHNDLHEQNVVILDRPGNLVAFIDFGEVVPLDKGQYKGGYKQDENLLAKEAGLLASCPKKALFPFSSEKISSDEKDERAKELTTCLEKAWCGQGEDCTFLEAFVEVIDEAYMHQHEPRPEVMTTTKVMDLYRTAFVQKHQPPLESFFPAVCDSTPPGPGPSATPTTTTATTTSAAAPGPGLLSLLALALLRLVAAR